MSSVNELSEVREIVEAIFEACNISGSDFTLTELKELYRDVEEKCNTENDYRIDDLPTGEVRIIDEDEIESIHEESIKQLFEDCYDLSDVPDVLKNNINWEQVAADCKRYDGYGNHFGSYSGEEHQASGFYIFRTN